VRVDDVLTVVSKAIVEGDPPDLPAEGYSSVARDFVRSCLNKIPAKRHTYPMLLAHPWMKSLSKPETITEDDEAEDAAGQGEDLANAADKLSLNNSDVVDQEVADWVIGVSDRKRKGSSADKLDKSRPALHTAPLDSVSPVGSPMVV
jgi:mitogen-activated protein kinase kinase